MLAFIEWLEMNSCTEFISSQQASKLAVEMIKSQTVRKTIYRRYNNKFRHTLRELK